ncbi:hypothetical protein DFH27DRAFT_521925 [Peziza echinospora]|nr:hypothetical protein DFH27DRAFT_521925 [Peziza echinospora]
MAGALDGHVSAKEVVQTSAAGIEGRRISSTALPAAVQTKAPQRAISPEEVTEVPQPVTQEVMETAEPAGIPPQETNTSRRPTARAGTDLTVSSMTSSQDSISPTTSRIATVHHRQSLSEANDSRRTSNHIINRTFQPYNGVECFSCKIPAHPDSLHRPLSYEFTINLTGKPAPLCVQFQTVPPDHPTSWPSSTAFPGTLPNQSLFKEENGKEKRRNSSVVVFTTSQAETSPSGVQRRGSNVGSSSASGVLISRQNASQIASLFLDSLRRDGGLSWGGGGVVGEGNVASDSLGQRNSATEIQSSKKRVSFMEGYDDVDNSPARVLNQGFSSSFSASAAASTTTAPQTAPMGASRTTPAEVVVVSDNDSTTQNPLCHHHHHHHHHNTPDPSRHNTPALNGNSPTTPRTANGNGGGNSKPQTASPKPYVLPVEEGPGVGPSGHPIIGGRGEGGGGEGRGGGNTGHSHPGRESRPGSNVVVVMRGSGRHATPEEEEEEGGPEDCARAGEWKLTEAIDALPSGGTKGGEP